VWAGGTATPPSPAFGADNTGTGALYASDTLVFVSGAGAKLTLGAGAVLQNNCNTQNGATPYNLGGGIRATGGAQVVIDGSGAELRYNLSGWVGGGIALHDTSAQNTKLTLRNGSVNNNAVTTHDGGGIAAENGVIEIRGGVITKNYAPAHGGGIIYSNSSAGLNAVISGGSITGNRAGAWGGGIGIGSTGAWTITMSGGAVISGNTAATDGGGVFIEGASNTFTMSGSAVISGNSASAFGGGINVSAGTFTMNGGTISNNEGIGGGAAVRSAGIFTMHNGVISENESRNEGGGVYIGGTATFALYGGTIRANSASAVTSSKVGGGVFVSNFSYTGGKGYFIKRGGTIYGNDAGADSNIAPAGGPAVFAGQSDSLTWIGNKYRNATAGSGIRMYFYNGGMNDPGSTTPPFPALDTSGAWLP
jgi:hypothetical protein